MTKEQILNFMRHQEQWCHELFLPMIRWINGKQEYAFMVGNSQINFAVLGHHKPTLYVGNMFELAGFLIPQLELLPKKEYSSLEALVEDGWEVD